MAYRQLYAVTFGVLGLVAVGCGGNTNSSASGGPDAAQQPPTNPDQPSSNSDQASSSSDQTPSNADQPPNNASELAGTGGGGRTGTLCHELCNSVEKLGDQCGGMPKGDTSNLCSANCQLPASYMACEQQIGDVFSCYLDNLALLCAAATHKQNPPAGDQQPAAAVPCQDTLKVFSKCAETNGINDGNAAANCTTDGGCECTSECLTCTCKAGSDTKKRLACADTCATP